MWGISHGVNNKNNKISLHVGDLSWCESLLHCSPIPGQQLPCNQTGVKIKFLPYKYVDLQESKWTEIKKEGGAQTSRSDKRLSRSLKTAMSTLAKNQTNFILRSKIKIIPEGQV